jgi:hypothetical protein
MWLELTQENNEAVLINTDLVTHIVEVKKGSEIFATRFFFSPSDHITVKEKFDRIMERLQLS